LSLQLSVIEKQLRMTEAHIAAVKMVCQKRDLFLFLRPSEVDSVLLIKAGYATKSMDVHHKSSNWGPMAGFVPCDPAFSKKFDGIPDPSPAPHGHDEAEPVQLFITNELLEYFLAEKKLAPVEDVAFSEGVLAAGHLRPAGALVKSVIDKARAEGNTGAQFSFYRATPAPAPGMPKFVTETVFALKRKGDSWLVWFLSPVPQGHKMVPLWVFGYKNKRGELLPVTGDYDIWMAAPHARWWKLHSQAVAVRDSHGSSAATMFNTWLIEELNRHCCGDKPDVFNHGAEAQNYGFTQSLDANLVMIGPMGTARMVGRSDLPAILAEIQLYGYMVIINKRWLEDDPHLMSKGNTKNAELRAKYMAAVNKLKTAKTKGEIDGLKLEKKALKKQMDPDYQALLSFSRKLEKLLENLWSASTEIHGLLPGEKPHDSKKLDPGLGKALQTELCNILVKATTGGGHTEEQQLEEWFLTKLPLLEQFSQAFGAAPAGPNVNDPLTGDFRDGDFVLRRSNKNEFARGTAVSQGGPMPSFGGGRH
jgi:Anthrax toxin LF subunit